MCGACMLDGKDQSGRNRTCVGLNGVGEEVGGRQDLNSLWSLWRLLVYVVDLYLCGNAESMYAQIN